MPPGLRNEVADQRVFLTSPEVTRLSVYQGDGAEVAVLVLEYDGWTVAHADLDGSIEGARHTGYDAAGNVVAEGAI
ncbi:hypothetical protein [Actinophytocola gossypii]|uniref:RHS repeat protein n=1 Tax=Actinophytocola gossypii TaxID=2812003 RepID=A0ABT2JF26_9PSEU|nr:hypothetical protein [Actinophytocola gossypii]MCT2586476.1 hypothetical protein [Actinophytocola gossypii]